MSDCDGEILTKIQYKNGDKFSEAEIEIKTNDNSRNIPNIHSLGILHDINSFYNENYDIEFEW